MTEGCKPRAVLLLGRDEFSNIVYNALVEIADIVAVIQEQPPPKVKMARRRIKRVGVLRVADQVLFITLVAPILKRTSSDRVEAIHAHSGMDATAIPPRVINNVPSVNHESVIDALRMHRPDVVIVNGTRIISKRVLTCVESPFINTHAGITPAYRGVHGGYWALAEGKPELAGVTVHYLDAGIDTGAVIAQALIQPSAEDNFHTYPTLQLAAGLPLLKRAVLESQGSGCRTVEPLARTSRLYYHPGLTQYLVHRFRRRVR